jgi:hypothetical protein
MPRRTDISSVLLIGGIVLMSVVRIRGRHR